jgi:hypothetical protein
LIDSGGPDDLTYPPCKWRGRMGASSSPPATMHTVTDRSAPSARTVLAFFLLGGCAVLGFSILVGFVGPKHGFQWDLASLFGTALGTTLLAAGTGALAYSTWSELRATWQLADLTKRDQDERERPVVLQQDATFDGNEETMEGWLHVALRNVGLGPALRVEVAADYADEWGNQPEIMSHVLPSIPPGGTETFQMFVRFPELRNEVNPDAFRLRGTFTDRSQRGSYEIITDWES